MPEKEIVVFKNHDKVSGDEWEFHPTPDNLAQFPDWQKFDGAILRVSTPWNDSTVIYWSETTGNTTTRYFAHQEIVSSFLETAQKFIAEKPDLFIGPCFEIHFTNKKYTPKFSDPSTNTKVSVWQRHVLETTAS
jgi:hypothetical protein